MKNRKITAVFGVFGALTLLSLPHNLALADQPTTPFYMNGVTGLSLAGVYTSPYVGGATNSPNASPSGSNPTLGPTLTGLIICDDFSDNTYQPEEWTTYVTNLTDLNENNATPGELKWNGATSPATLHGPIATVDGQTGWSLTQIQAYDVAADLAVHILNLQNTVNPTQQDKTDQENYSFALWELFAPTQAAAVADSNWGGTTDNVVGWLSTAPNILPGNLSAATTDLESAIGDITGGNYHGLDNDTVTIYSYDASGPAARCGTGLTSICTPGELPPQEFISVIQGQGTTTLRVPEASFFDTFSLYFLAGGVGLVFLSRRKIFRAQD